MTTIDAMTTDALTALLDETDARIRDLDQLLSRTPSDTAAFKAMAESRPELIRFRHRLDDALASCGA